MRTSILLVVMLLGTILCQAQEVGEFYGSTDGSESIALNLGKVTSGPALMRFYTEDGGAGILRIHSYRWGGDFIWSRSSSEGIQRPIARLYAGSGASCFDLYDYNQNVKIKINANGNSYFNASNVGIGITEPSSILHVKQGNSGGSPHDFSKITVEHSANAMISILTPNNNIGYFGFADSDDQFVGGMYYSHSSNVLGFRVNDQYTPSLEIRSDGNVGIGVSNASYKLTVDGVISSTEVKVSATPNSDYVFEPDYNLLPISEVESFIKENKHLPEIPSAEEFKENGVGLGEMDDMLLRKVEELVLYTIKQQKEIEELKEENESLKMQYTAMVVENGKILSAVLKEIENLKNNR